MEKFEENEKEFNEELARIYNEDQQDRIDKLWEQDVNLMQERDDARLYRVIDMVEAGLCKTPADYYYAAMVLQHGRETRHYKMAHEFVSKAVGDGFKEREGEVDPVWLIAATKDRSLMSEGKPQMYGTQSLGGGPNDPVYMYEVDPTTTDEERAHFHVQPLAVLQKRIEDANKPKD